MPSPNDIKKGTVLKIDGELWVVLDFQRVSPGKGSSFVRTRIKNIKTGKIIDNNFKSADSLEFEDVEYKRMQFLFTDGNMFTFMDNRNYEQISLGKDEVGDDARYLKEGLEVSIVTHNDSPLTMELPRKIQYTVVQAPPAVKGDTASGNVTKEIVTDNGLKVAVPIFIKEGEEILVNTDTGDYAERVSQ